MVANPSAIRFTSTSYDRIDFGAAALGSSIKNLDTFTIEAWIKVGPNATTNLAKAYLERQGAGKYPRLAIAAWNYVQRGIGKLRFEFARVDGTQDTNYTYNLATLWDDYWHHVAFTVNIGDKEYKIYLDFALVAQGSVPDGGKDGSNNPLKVSNTAPQAIIVGAGYDGTNYTYWDGKIDNIRIWSSVRSQTAIQSSAYDHIANPSGETSLIEEWRFNENTGSSTAGAKNTSWTATLKRNEAASSALWTIDRPFLGDGNLDETPPADFTMNAPSNITSSSFTLSWNSTTDDVYVQYYEVTVATDSAFNNPISGYAAKNVGLSTSITVTGLLPATNYYARVRAFDAALNATNYATYNNNAPITTLSAGDTTPPTAPTALAATSVTDTSFIANWSAATDNVGVAGYKLDVATDPDFTNFVASYRNLDVGNVLTYSVNSGIYPSTVYYYRVRAYDASFNESSHSNTITVTTANPPDTTPPDVVVLAPATSIGSRSFTANWNPGVDNVAVTGYYLDVALDASFTTYVPGYQNLNVGNVTSYGITGLYPQTQYYYRVRAYDAAGNVSNNTTSPESVVTAPSAIDDGGPIETILEPIADTYVNQAASSTNYGSATTLSVDGSSGAIKRAYLLFDLSELRGTIINANLNLYVTDASAGTISIKRVTSGTWSENTLTYSNDTLVQGTEVVTFVPSTTGWVEIDVASLLVSGLTQYTLALSTTSTDILAFSSREGSNPPYLVVETDPSNLTEVRTLSLSSSNQNITNLLNNPSAETGGPSFGGTTGIVALSGSTLTQDSAYAYDGSYSVRVATPATANSGVIFESSTGLNIAGGGTFSALVAARANSAISIQVRLRVIYTDATQTDITSLTRTINTDWRVFLVSGTTTSGKTVNKVEVHVMQTAATAQTFWADAAIAVAGGNPLAFFAGNSGVDTDWDGTAHASTSTYRGATINVLGTYIGDGNGNNSVTVKYKRSETSDWIQLDKASINRSTKQVTATVLPIQRANELFNPSFTNNTAFWYTTASGTTPTRITTDGMEEDGASDRACLQVAGDGTVANQGVKTSHLVLATQNSWFTFSLYAKAVSGASSLQLQLVATDANGSDLTTLTQNIALTSSWQRYSISGQLTNANTRFVYVKILNPSASAATWCIDWAQLENRAFATPYVDGSIVDGEWEGKDHESATYRVLHHEYSYDVSVLFSDADGVVGTNPISESVTTLPVPEDAITVTALDLTPDNTSITAVARYNGDDNQSALAKVEWKRSDLGTWSIVPHVFDRQEKTVLATISGLKPGTSYDVRVTFTDPDDPVYGPNPIQQTAVTTIKGLNADAVTRITFGGFVLLGDEQHYVGVTEHDAFSLPERRTQVEVLPRMDGAVELSDYWGKRVITMRGFIEGETRADLHEKVREFRKALAPRQQQLVVDTLDSRGYFFNATCTSLVLREVGGETIRHLLWEAEFTCADPFRYESSETVESNIVLNNNDTVSISNDGDLRVEPIITVTTNNTVPTSFSIINTTTSERIRPATTIVSGDVIEINSSKLILTKNGVELDYDGAFPMLAVGTNVLKASVSTGSIIITVRRRHRYF